MKIKLLNTLKDEDCTRKFFGKAVITADTFTGIVNNCNIGRNISPEFSRYAGKLDNQKRGVFHSKNTIFQSSLVNVFSPGEGWKLDDERFDYSYRDYKIYYKNLYEQEIPKYPKEINGNVCLIFGQWGTEYYHFVHETIPKLHMMDHLGILNSMDHIIIPEKAPHYVYEWLNMMGICNNKITELNNKEYYLAKDLYIPTQFTITAKSSLNLKLFLTSKISRIQKAESNPLEIPKVFLNRRGKRKIANFEPHHLEKLRSVGFRMLYPEDFSCLEQYTIFSNAKQILAPHGANMANTIFSKASIIELIGSNYTNTCYCDIAALLNNPYYYMQCEDLSENLYVDWDSLFEYLDFLR